MHAVGIPLSAFVLLRGSVVVASLGMASIFIGGKAVVLWKVLGDWNVGMAILLGTTLYVGAAVYAIRPHGHA